MTGSADIIQLRKLLFDDNYDALLALRAHYENREDFKDHVSQVIAEAIEARLDADQSLPKTLSPVIEQTLIHSIQQHPKTIADVLYPVMGPAIRKSIYQTLADSLAQFNQMLEHSFSIRALRWRFDAWRTEQSYAHVMMMNTLEYQVEQVFLIHRENGLLLHHIQAEHALSKDPDMVSGMLTAIQDFIKDSFNVDHEDNLRQMRLGELTVQMEHGPHAVIACVIRGYAPNYLNDLLSDTLETIHQEFDQSFKDYSGDTDAFLGSEPWLRNCLIKQQQQTSKKKSSTKFLYLLIAGLLGLAGYAFYQSYHNQQQWQAVFSELEQTPSFVILNKTETSDGYSINALIDPLADDPSDIIQRHAIARNKTTLNLTPYLSMHKKIVSKRIKKTLNLPDSVDSKLSDEGILMLSGTAREAWLEKLQQDWQTVSGLQGIHTDHLTIVPTEESVVVDTRPQQIQTLISDIENYIFLFDVKAIHLAKSEQKIQQLADSIIELLQLTNSMQQSLQINIIGKTDQTGNPLDNEQLRRQRETYMQRMLVQAGVPSFILLSQSQFSENQSNQYTDNERSVRFQVRVY